MIDVQNGRKSLRKNMSETITINTSTNTYVTNMREWNIKTLKAQKQWESQKWISAPGLCDLVINLVGKEKTIVGLEIGVASGWTMNHFLENLPNLNLTGIDPYVGYMDGHIEITQEMLDAQYLAAQDNISDFAPRGKILKGYSQDFVNLFENESLDYIFIDGDHSYEGALSDCELFFPKIKNGGIFAGHDWSLNGVRQAVIEFKDRHGSPEIKFVREDVWYWIKK
jgi:predicted O-methyltransferase YrrM